MSKRFVGVQSGLDDISKNLNELGFEVVGIDDTENPLDAIVYSSKMSDNSSGIRYNGEIEDLSGVDSDGMVLMLNADEYSVQELVSKIKDLFG